jgi:hypothetical protein
MQTLTKHFLCLALLLPFNAINAVTTPTQVEVQDRSQFVYLSSDIREALRCLRNWPNCTLSARFVALCDGLAQDRIAASYEDAVAIVRECLELCKNCPDLKDVEAVVRQYEAHLRNGDANLMLIDDTGMITRACGSCNSCNTCDRQCIKFKKTKAFCSLLAHDLQVDGSGFIANLTVGTLRVTGAAAFDGDVEFAGDIFAGDLIVDDLTVNGTFTANGPVNMGTDDTAAPINIATGAAPYPLVLGTTNTTASTTILAGSGGLTANAAGLINIGTAANNFAINIGTLGIRDITVGNTLAGSSLTLNGGVDGTAVSGVAVSGSTTATEPAADNTAANNNRVGQVSFIGFTTAANADEDFVLLNATISPTSRILVTSFTNGAEDAIMTVHNIDTSVAGQATITLNNTGAAALLAATTVFINFWVLN